MARGRKPGLKLAKPAISSKLPSTNGENSEQNRPEKPAIEEPKGLGIMEEHEYDVRSLDEGSKKDYDLEMHHKTENWAAEVEEQSFQDSAKETWAKFRESIHSYGGTKLHYSEPYQKDGQIVAKLDMEEIEVEASFWKSAIICVVIGANPPLAVFEGFVKRIWGKLGIVSVARMNAGFTMVKFRDEAARDLVLESGVVHFDRKPVVLRPWTTDVESLKSIKSVPIWIRLPDLGLQYWGVNCLSALVSTIGKPIMIDQIT
ncbi:uncharacterized protein LOC133825281 [Humulus lupulus]|uniref:uncharacterized protein LOC133825281 n=1 Tax=Humulus lupulus TaxID=3486 RepID=UPI002B4112E6|nr:uncharacterized protein LOC133825281 [Humulus lupulus]